MLERFKSYIEESDKQLELALSIRKVHDNDYRIELKSLGDTSSLFNSSLLVRFIKFNDRLCAENRKSELAKEMKSYLKANKLTDKVNFINK